MRQHELAFRLEQFRALAGHFEPDTDARDMDDLCHIIQPAQATSMDEYARKLPAWNAAYQTRLNRVGPSAVLADSMRRAIWIRMLPNKERDDVMRHRHLWATAEDLARHLAQLINDRTTGRSGIDDHAA